MLDSCLQLSCISFPHCHSRYDKLSEKYERSCIVIVNRSLEIGIIRIQEIYKYLYNVDRTIDDKHIEY